MQNIIENNTTAPVTGAYQTDALRHGIGNSTVSSNWWNRPADERFLSLDDLIDFKKADARQMNSKIVNTHKMQILVLMFILLDILTQPLQLQDFNLK